jgi:hypothetical protein
LRAAGLFSANGGPSAQAINLLLFMAQIPYPVSMAMVKGVKRHLDFYFQRGKQVVRTWPKKSNLIPTPGQLIQRNNFRAIECCLKSQGPMMRAAWQAWNPPVGQTWVDFVHRVWMQPAFRGTLLCVQDFFEIRVRPRSFPGPATLYAAWDPAAFPDAPKLDIIWTIATDDKPKWKWIIFDYKIQRGKLIQPRWAPSITPLQRSAPTTWDVARGHGVWPLERRVSKISFSFVNHADDNPQSLLSACIHATPSGWI